MSIASTCFKSSTTTITLFIKNANSATLIIIKHNNHFMSTDTTPITKQLIDLITKGNAHVTFEQAVENISLKNIGIKPTNLPCSIWMLTEHMRIAQADILDF